MNGFAAHHWRIIVSWRMVIFALAALVVGPLCVLILAYTMAHPYSFAAPAATLALVALSYLFGFWKGVTGVPVKVVALLWSGLVGWFSPMILIYAACYGGTLLGFHDTCI